MFNDISPEHKSYIVGFLQGDGSHYEQSRNRGKIGIELSSKDIDILDKIETVLERFVNVSRNGRKRNTNFKTNYNSNILSIFDLDTRRQFKPFIPTSKKASIIKPPIKMEGFCKYHYIRGLSDADGSIGVTSKNRTFWSLCTSSEYIKNFILNDIKNVLNFDKRLNRNKRDNVYNIVLFDEDAIEYTKLLYDNATIYLNRKYSKYLDFKKWKRTIPKSKSRKKKWLDYEDKVILNNTLSIKEKMLLLSRTEKSIKMRFWRLKQK